MGSCLNSNCPKGLWIAWGRKLQTRALLFYLPRISFGSYWDWNPTPSAETLSSRLIIASNPSEGMCLNPGQGASPNDDVDVDLLESVIDTTESRFPEYGFISWSVSAYGPVRLGRLARTCGRLAASAVTLGPGTRPFVGSIFLPLRLIGTRNPRANKIHASSHCRQKI